MPLKTNAETNIVIDHDAGHVTVSRTQHFGPATLTNPSNGATLKCVSCELTEEVYDGPITPPPFPDRR